jgi:hypothetical protein
MKWLDCQEDYLNATAPHNETCAFDESTEDFYETYGSACKESGGEFYVLDYRLGCEKGDYGIDSKLQNGATCIVFAESSCQAFISASQEYISTSLNDWDFEGPIHNRLIERGHSCSTLGWDFHPFGATYQKKNRAVIGIVVGLGGAVVLIVVAFVLYLCPTRNQPETERSKTATGNEACQDALDSRSSPPAELWRLLATLL